MSIYLPNELINLILSYRPVHPIVENTNLTCLIELYNNWNAEYHEKNVSFGYFVSRCVYNYDQTSKKHYIESIQNEDDCNEDYVCLRDLKKMALKESHLNN